MGKAKYSPRQGARVRAWVIMERLWAFAYFGPDSDKKARKMMEHQIELELRRCLKRRKGRKGKS